MSDNHGTDDLRSWFWQFVFKVGGYLLGVLIGLSAKLAQKHKENKLTWSEGILQSSLAFAAAWACWHWLEYLDQESLKLPVSVFVGRFGDNILLIIWDFLKKFFRQLLSETLKS